MKMYTTHKNTHIVALVYFEKVGPPNSPPTTYIQVKIGLGNQINNFTYDSSNDQNNEAENSDNQEDKD